jgi:XrtN system VIT domain protein
MVTTFKPFDRLFITGCALIAVSLLWYCLPLWINIPTDTHFGFFVGNYVITVIYFFILWGSGRLRRDREGLYSLLLFLILFLISAYSLNREMSVFESSVGWFTTLEVIVCLNYIAFAFFEKLSPKVQHLMCFILGIATLAFAYLSFYLVPLYAISAIGFFALGISLHTFVPVLFCIYTIILIRRKAAHNSKLWFSFGAGVTTMIIIAVVYTLQWSSVVNTMNTSYRKAELIQKNNLPGWIAVAQKLPRGSISRAALKSDLVYAMPVDNSDQLDGFFWRMPSRSFDEQRKHDPLVMVAALFGGKPNVPEEYRIKVLESIYDSRHQAQERFWSGENLFTENVKTAVQIWPQFCLAYTEKNITVTNASLRRRWRNQEEAIYTFHLPEGTVVTSLSLWIEGQEQKGLLTTKEKAATAYQTIVGREMRDPSVVHWQEGNTVSVRVFPVIAGESRLFKIGFTSPLGHKNDKLVYRNVYFDGPSTDKTTEEVSLEFEKTVRDFIVPASFSTHNNTSFKTGGKYRSDWGIELAREPLSTDAFSFNGKSFRMRPYQKQRATADFNFVYMDVNESWSMQECEQVYDMFRDKVVLVYDEGIKGLTNENFGATLRRLKQNKFSLFPIHEITDARNALLVSKSTANSPNLRDLKDTRFVQSMKTYLQQSHKLRLFNIGTELSPYLKSLKEYRVFDYEEGNVADLQKLAASRTFATDIESDERVVVDNADVAIVQEPGDVTTGNAPDHLMRLFAYNHVMKKLGSRLVTGEELNQDLVDEAKEACIVSPVSSLIVLETQRDYDRFNITESEKSLHNASMASKGAVPEPHEWALIIIAVATLLYIKFRPTFKLS